MFNVFPSVNIVKVITNLTRKDLYMNGNNRGYIQVFFAGLLWGTIGIFGTLLGNMGLTSSEISFYRLLSASVLLALVLLVKGKGMSLFKISKRGLISCILIGAISQAIYNIFYMGAVNMTGMSTAAVLLYTSPVFVMIISRICFKELITPVKLFAIILNIIGCVLTVTGGDFSGIQVAFIGVVFGVMAGFTYGLMPIFSRLGADDENAFTTAFYGLFFGMVTLFFIARPYQGLSVPFTTNMLLVIIGFGLIPSAIAYIIYFGGLSKVKETSIIPVLCSVENVAASFFGFLIFHEHFTFWKVVGVALVFISIMVINMKKNKVEA